LLAFGSGAAVLLMGPLQAAANECQANSQLSACIAADNLWPYPGGGRWQALATPHTARAGTISVGVAFSYLSRPIGLQVTSADPEGTTVYAVQDVFDATFLTAFGVTDQLQLTLSVPTVLYQNGAGLTDVLGSDDHLPRSAVGDMRFGFGLSLLEKKRTADGVALAGRFEVAAPTGDESAFVTSGSSVFIPGLSLTQQVGRFHWSADVAARIRATRQLAGARIGSQIFSGLGVSCDILADQWLSAGAEAFFLFTLAQQQSLERDPTSFELVAEPAERVHVPAEWLLSVRSAGLLDGRLVTSIAAGGSIPTAAEAPVTTPGFRFVTAVHYAFEDADE